jgi:hypothetical protein
MAKPLPSPCSLLHAVCVRRSYIEPAYKSPCLTFALSACLQSPFMYCIHVYIHKQSSVHQHNGKQNAGALYLYLSCGHFCPSDRATPSVFRIASRWNTSSMEKLPEKETKRKVVITHLHGICQQQHIPFFSSVSHSTI